MSLLEEYDYQCKDCAWAFPPKDWADSYVIAHCRAYDEPICLPEYDGIIKDCDSYVKAEFEEEIEE